MPVILAIALIVFSPQKLPELGKALGKAISEFKKTTEGVKGSLEVETEDLRELKGTMPRENLLADLAVSVSHSMQNTAEQSKPAEISDHPGKSPPERAINPNHSESDTPHR
jgi:sec-independent protein translocase protein TatA